MQITLQAHDVVIAVLAVIGTVMLFGAGLAVLVRLLGRRLPEVEEAAAIWLLRDAAGWRARTDRKVALARWTVPEGGI